MDILYKTSQCSEWDFPEGRGDFQAKSLHEGTVESGEGMSEQNPSAGEVWKFCIISHFQYSTFKRGGGFPNKEVRIFCRTTQCKTLDFPEGRGFPSKISPKEKC